MVKRGKAIQDQNFINTVFHELRIPLSSINGYASLFITGELGKISQSHLKIIRKIRDLALYASEVINNLFSLSSLSGRRKVHYEKISLLELAQRALTTLNVQIRARSLKIHLQFNQKIKLVWTFPTDIEQIIINTFSNAVKFTPKNGHIHITLIRKANKLYLRIRDTGIGIPPEALSRIFEDFYRADNVARQYDGSGLGLSIVKKLLAYSKGDISIKSKLNKGTCIEIALPIVTDQEVFDYELEQAVSESARSNISFGLVMVVDRTSFKKSSRRNLLKWVNAAIRKRDRSYQIDMGKCLVILPEVGYAEARFISDRLKSILQEKVLLDKKKRTGSLNLAVAVAFAVFPADGTRKGELISFLDREIKKPSALVAGVSY